MALLLVLFVSLGVGPGVSAAGEVSKQTAQEITATVFSSAEACARAVSGQSSAVGDTLADVAITLSGRLPAGATAKAYPVNVSVTGQTILGAYDITIYDGAGEKFEPEGDAVAVSIQSQSLAGVSGASVYHLQDESAQPQLVAENIAASDSKVQFQAASFSIYVVTKSSNQDSTSPDANQIAVNDSTNPCYIKMDTGSTTVVKANRGSGNIQSVSWASSDTSVVTVASGSVSGGYYPATLTAQGGSLAAGASASADVTVTFTYKSGSHTRHESAVIHVTVEKPSAPTGSSVGQTTHGKTVVKRSGGAAAITSIGDPVYDLSLNFSGTTQNFAKKQDVDVVFVVDVSGSMNYSIGGYGGTSRLQAAKNAITYLQNLAGPSGKDLNARYALVCFSGDDDGSAYNDAMIRQGWSTAVDTNNISVGNNDQTGRGTNYEAGLLLADSLIANDRSSAKKLVVFLSDGEPTFRYGSDGKTVGYGDSYSPANLTNAVTQATKIKADGADYFFAVGCGDLTGNVSYNPPITGRDILHGLTQPFGDTAGNNVLLAGDETSLNNAFAAIINSTSRVTSQNISIVDALSGNVDIYDTVSSPNGIYDPTQDTNDGILKQLVKVSVWQGATEVTPTGFSPSVTYDRTNRVLTVSLGQGYSADPSDTYKVTYPVVASESAKDAFAAQGAAAYINTADADTGTYAGQAGFFTNVQAAGLTGEHPNPSGTYVTYQKISTDGSASQTLYESYPMPVIQVQSTGLTLKKADDNGAFLAGSAFTLYRKNQTNSWVPVTGVANGVYTVPDAGAAVSGLINGGLYKLVETTVPSGCLKASDVYFTMLNGQIQPTDTVGQTTAGWPGDTAVQSGNILTVTNHMGYTLPLTGGVGTGGFRLIGVGMMLSALAGIFLLFQICVKRRRNLQTPNGGGSGSRPGS